MPEVVSERIGGGERDRNEVEVLPDLIDVSDVVGRAGAKVEQVDEEGE